MNKEYLKVTVEVEADPEAAKLLKGGKAVTADDGAITYKVEGANGKVWVDMNFQEGEGI